MMGKRHFTLLLIFLFFLLTGCQASLEEELKETAAAAEAAMETPADKINQTFDDISYHLPFGFEVESESANNIILKNGSKTYILFFNPHEGDNSKIVYDATVNQSSFEMNETFEKNDRFGFLLVKKAEDQLYEVTAGIGGVKLTTQAKTKVLHSEVKTMMEIVNSVRMKSE